MGGGLCRNRCARHIRCNAIAQSKQLTAQQICAFQNYADGMRSEWESRLPKRTGNEDYKQFRMTLFSAFFLCRGQGHAYPGRRSAYRGLQPFYAKRVHVSHICSGTAESGLKTTVQRRTRRLLHTATPPRNCGSPARGNVSPAHSRHTHTASGNKKGRRITPAEIDGAGDGSRTHVASLEGWSFTVKQHPHEKRRVCYFFPKLLTSTFFGLAAQRKQPNGRRVRKPVRLTDHAKTCAQRNAFCKCTCFSPVSQASNRH